MYYSLSDLYECTWRHEIDPSELEIQGKSYFDVFRIKGRALEIGQFGAHNFLISLLYKKVETTQSEGSRGAPAFDIKFLEK